jgi:ketosteroid isomerase-like protein
MSALEVMERYIAAVRRGDWDAAYGFLADDVAAHLPGRSTLAGELRGRQAVIGYIEAARAKSRGSDVEVEVVAKLASEARVMLLVRERFALAEGDRRDRARQRVHRARRADRRGVDLRG